MGKIADRRSNGLPTGSANKKRERSLKIWVPVFSVFVVLVILEVFFRIQAQRPRPDWFKRQIIFEKAPEPLFAQDCAATMKLVGDENIKYPDLNFSYRDYHYEPRKPENTFRILGTGDSFAWGWGVHNSLFISFKRLECWFSKENRGKKIEVINGAQPGAWLPTEEIFLKNYGYDLQPDMILLQYNLNDAATFHGIVPFEAWAQYQVGKKNSFLDRISKFYEFVHIRITRNRLRRWTLKTYHEAYFGKDTTLWKRCQSSLLNIAQECRKRNIVLVVSIFPLLYNLEKKHYEFANEVNEIESFLHRSDILCHNMLPDFMGRDSSSLWVLPNDSHPNKWGHQIAAESTYRFLTRHHLLPPLLQNK